MILLFLFRVVIDYCIFFDLSGKNKERHHTPRCSIVSCFVYLPTLSTAINFYTYRLIDPALNMGIHIGHFSGELSSSLPVIGAIQSGLMKTSCHRGSHFSNPKTLLV